MRSSGCISYMKCLRWLVLALVGVAMVLIMVSTEPSAVVVETKPNDVQHPMRSRINVIQPPWMKKYEKEYGSSGCQPGEITMSFESDTTALSGVAQRRWVRPEAPMETFMLRWREEAATQPNISEAQHEMYLGATRNELVVFDDDPCKNTVPLCPNAGQWNVWERWAFELSGASSQERLERPVDQRYEVLLLGDSHLRELARLLCIMDMGGSACHCMNTREHPLFCHFYYQTLSVTYSWVNLRLDSTVLDLVENLWQSHAYNVSDEILSLTSKHNYRPAVVVFGTGAHLLASGLSSLRIHDMTLEAMTALRNRYPVAEIVLMPDWFHHVDAAHVGVGMFGRDVMLDPKPPEPHRIGPHIERQQRVKQYLAKHTPAAVQLERLAVVCGAVAAGARGMNISIFDLWSITESIPDVNVTDIYGQHYHGAFGEALALKLVRDHLCRLPEYGSKRYLLPVPSGSGEPGSITDPSHFPERICSSLVKEGEERRNIPHHQRHEALLLKK